MKKPSDVLGRTVVAIPLAILAVVLVAAGGWVFAVGVTAIGCLCLHEFYDLVESRRPLRLAGFLSIFGAVIAAKLGGPTALLFATWLSLPVMFVMAAAQPRLEGATDSILATGLGIWWIAVGFAHAVLLRDLAHGGGIVLDALIATFAGDTGAYFGGRSFGTKPLAPRISPRKTVEGLIAGAAAAIASTLVASLYQDWLPLEVALLIGVTVAVLAPMGDLFESLLKREAGAKDAATTLGPHGGALDRLDGVLFSIVGVYWLWYLLG
ncbi:MAG: phosphatidate cytidylyltransferase [Actinomycetes bacterium]